jgi:hypothetical protein
VSSTGESAETEERVKRKKKWGIREREERRCSKVQMSVTEDYQSVPEERRKSKRV